MMIDYQHLMTYFNESPIYIQVAWGTSLILAIAIVCLSVYLKVLRFHLRKKEIENKLLKSEYEALIIEYLYTEDELGDGHTFKESVIEQLQSAILIESKRKLIISILYNLTYEVSGELSDTIKTLYIKAGFVAHALKRLESKHWYIIAKGIGELSHFRIDNVYNNVSKFLDHPRLEVRKETELYLVELFKFKGLSFLNTLTDTLSEWMQLRLLETLQKFDDQQICDINPWLKSQNESVILFAIKLAQIYNQFEVQNTLTELLSHPKKQVRIAAIQALTHLYGIEAKEMLKANFNDLSLEEQICFFGMLEKLVMPSDEPFVEKYLFHKNFDIQLLALKILKSINIEKYMGLSKTTTNEKDSSMIELVNTI
ncbi:HEAT repeat domain-containing protein [Sabulilitoribacter arenilitoris]|uniref:HEAT repeat domain-containing protein n=1 Tax=Wocania arenilitoris TaxID=2044858 RepID=A0AAE3EML4_9FLAO|nr:HEAT repeat domain-containing protein [Wocania arenilitoris]MCF7567014.1 HEAT repeat domain-containing protein [Wocania arenilitoris]